MFSKLLKDQESKLLKGQDKGFAAMVKSSGVITPAMVDLRYQLAFDECKVGKRCVQLASMSRLWHIQERESRHRRLLEIREV